MLLKRSHWHFLGNETKFAARKIHERLATPWQTSVRTQ
jgi:hypothetical protein